MQGIVVAVGAAEERPAVPFYWFHLGSPLTYLRAEQADRLLPELTWRPAQTSSAPAVSVEAVEQEAADRGMPLVWPDAGEGPELRHAMRVASLAVDLGRAGSFVLAATRLAYCGGYDLDDLAVLKAAGAAAGIDPAECAQAAGDADRDRVLLEAGRELDALGGDELPAVEVAGRLFTGPTQVLDASEAMRVRQRSARRVVPAGLRPVAPAVASGAA